MAASVSVIIPSLNEAERIAHAVAAAFAAGASEVIVADGGSTDATVESARRSGARVVTDGRMRARQMNRGAESASGEFLMFLHADTRLAAGACETAARALDEGAVFGGFSVAFAEPSVRLKIAAAMINLRTAFTRCPWGDQAQFVRRDVFLRDGGFREIPIMEDYELAVRMKRRGLTVVLPQKVITSGRRFLEKGLLRTAATNWRIVVAWHGGEDPAKLAEWYRGKTKH
jgi:rSAM/selenodomain-associated transferase 2